VVAGETALTMVSVALPPGKGASLPEIHCGNGWMATTHRPAVLLLDAHLPGDAPV
jgi:hypothetical protein